MKREQSGLLDLLNARYKMLGLGQDKPYHKPVFDPSKVRAAALAYSQLESSDPFTYARAMLYMERGYELPSDILKDNTAALARRQQHNVTAVSEALAPIKRRIDEDRAWNQHRHAKYKETA